MKSLCTYTIFVLILALSSCSSTKTVPVTEPGRDPAEYVAEGQKAMVSTSNPAATKAGLQMLKQGGNAIDAAVAVTFAIGVVRPHSTGIGGGGFMLYYDSLRNETAAYDFRERAPEAATRSMFINRNGSPKSFVYEGKVLPNASINGHLASGVPGLVKGIIDLHRKYGKLPLSTVMQPAINLAENGFPVYRDLAEALAERADVLKVFPGSKNIFLKADSKPYQLGDTLVQRDLARTLQLISAKGAAGFYEGEVAQKILTEIRRGKGIISLNDLRRYAMKVRTPIVGTYRGYKIVSMPPPSSGGVHIIQMLNMLEPFSMSELGHMSNRSIHLTSEVMRRAFADRAEFMGDPDFVSIPVDKLIAKSYANSRMTTFTSQKAGNSNEIKAGQPLVYESGSTTHFSIVDPFGNAVSSTQTINGHFGSGVVVQGTGIVLNNEMDDFSIKPGVPNLFGLVGNEANAVAARKTMLSSMSPTIVFNKEGQLDLIVGSPGGPRIINATFQTIINRIDFKLPMDEAVFAYRVHHQWLPDILYIESGALESEQINGLRAMGHDIQERGSIGLVQAIGRESSGGWTGVADSRDNGMAAGF